MARNPLRADFPAADQDRSALETLQNYPQPIRKAGLAAPTPQNHKPPVTGSFPSRPGNFLHSGCNSYRALYKDLGNSVHISTILR